jgi:hypothetical protein
MSLKKTISSWEFFRQVQYLFMPGFKILAVCRGHRNERAYKQGDQMSL